MTMERFKEMSPNHFSPVDIILEWKKDYAVVHHGESQYQHVTLDREVLDLDDESVDKIVLSDLTSQDKQLNQVFEESKRILKSNGRIFIAIGDFNNTSGRINRFLTKFKIDGLMDSIAKIVSEKNLLIDKNFILDDRRIYLEIVKLESDYIRKRIAI
jgi:hypothetical protein